jgi:hypothetical protein
MGRQGRDERSTSQQWTAAGGKDEAAKYAELWRFMPKSWERYVTDPDPVNVQRRADGEIPLE